MSTYREDNNLDKMRSEIDTLKKENALLVREKKVALQESKKPSSLVAFSRHISVAALPIAPIGAAVYTGNMDFLYLLCIMLFWSN